MRHGWWWPSGGTNRAPERALNVDFARASRPALDFPRPSSPVMGVIMVQDDPEGDKLAENPGDTSVVGTRSPFFLSLSLTLPRSALHVRTDVRIAL